MAAVKAPISLEQSCPKVKSAWSRAAHDQWRGICTLRYKNQTYSKPGCRSYTSARRKAIMLESHYMVGLQSLTSMEYAW